MAAPTVSFFSASAGTNSSLLSVWMPQLHSMLIAKGWTLAYADADAIGSSLDPSTPAWDKTPATNTDAGLAVYRMPANGHDTQWFVRLRPGWAANTNRPHMRGVTVGTAHDGSGNVTGGGGNEFAPGVSTVQTDNRQVMLAVSEDGFFFLIPTAASNQYVLCHVERARRSDTGAVTDDLIVYNQYGAPATGIVRASVGIVHTLNPIVLATLGTVDPSGNMSGYSLQSYDGSMVPILGPYWPRGFPWFHGRLGFLLLLADNPINSDRDLAIDGGSKTYRTAGVGLSTTYGIWAVATE